MELCITRLLSALPSQRTTCTKNPIYLPSEPSTFLNRSALFRSSVALQSRRCGLDNSVSRAAISEEGSGGSGSNQYVTEERQEVIIDSLHPDKTIYGKYVIPEVPNNEELTAETGTETFLDNLRMLNETSTAMSILSGYLSNRSTLLILAGFQSLVPVCWLVCGECFSFPSAVVGVIDSIPVFPKLMEVVGLGYTLVHFSQLTLQGKQR